MKDQRISRVTLAKWRGGTLHHEFSIDPNKGFVLLYGENGNGKSTIIDAIEYVLTGSTGSLEYLSLDGETRTNYLASLGAAMGEAKASVQIGSVTFNATPGRPSKAKGIPKVFSIRRAVVQRLTEAIPSERYKLIAPCFDVSAVEKCEGELAKAVKDLERRVERSEAQTGAAFRALESAYEGHAKRKGTAAEILAWVRARAAHDTEAFGQVKTDYDTVIKEFSALETACKIFNKRNEELVVLQVQQQRSELESKAKGIDLVQRDLISILTSAKAYVEGSQSGVCPVCEQTFELEVLLGNLEERIKTMQPTKTVVDQHASITTEQKKKETIVANEFEAAKSAVDVFKVAILKIPQSDHDLALKSWLAEFPATCEQAIDNAKTFVDSYTGEHSPTPRWTSLRDNVVSKIEAYASLKRNLSTFDEFSVQATTDAEILTRLKSAKSRVEQLRKAFIKRELKAISNDVRSMYAVVHPEEPYVPGAMELLENKPGSLVHRGELAGKEIMPVAYYSESHLDTLAFCVHLALAKRLGHGKAILLVDDIITSVDNRHLDRMIDLLMQEAHHFAQVVFATHFGRCASRFAQNRVAVNDVCRLTLLPWDISTGVRVREYPLEVDRLTELIQDVDTDRQSIASKAGYLMESALDVVVTNYRCSCPKAADGENTLAELRNAFHKTASQFEKEEGEIVDKVWITLGSSVKLQNHWEALAQNFGIRNDVGAHFKKIGDDEPLENVLEFARSAVNVLSVLTCSKCKSLPRKVDSSYWTCACRRARFTPVTRA